MSMDFYKTYCPDLENSAAEQSWYGHQRRWSAAQNESRIQETTEIYKVPW